MFLEIRLNYREFCRKKYRTKRISFILIFRDCECRDSDTASYEPRETTKNNMNGEKLVSCWNQSRKKNGGKGRAANTCWFARGRKKERCQIHAARSRAIYHCQYLQSFSVHRKYLQVIVAVKPRRAPPPNARLAENDALPKRKRVHGASGDCSVRVNKRRNYNVNDNRTTVARLFARSRRTGKQK